MIVMTGYDVVARAKVIKRWQELEKKAHEKTAHIEPPKPSKPLLIIPSTTESKNTPA